MKKRLKWIIPSAVLLLLIVAMVSLAATGAWFSDTNEVGPNYIKAGTLQLDVDDMAVGGATYNFAVRRPCGRDSRSGRLKTSAPSRAISTLRTSWSRGPAAWMAPWIGRLVG